MCLTGKHNSARFHRMNVSTPFTRDFMEQFYQVTPNAWSATNLTDRSRENYIALFKTIF